MDQNRNDNQNNRDPRGPQKPKGNLWVTLVITAAIVVRTLQLTGYLPVLLVAGLVTGAIIGTLAKLLMPRVQKALQSFH